MKLEEKAFKKKEKRFWCKIGFHKLEYVSIYLHTSILKCKYCGAEFLEGLPGELYKL